MMFRIKSEIDRYKGQYDDRRDDRYKGQFI